MPPKKKSASPNPGNDERLERVERQQSELVKELSALRQMLFFSQRFEAYQTLSEISDANLRAMRATLPEFFPPEQLPEALKMGPERLAEIWQIQKILEFGLYSFVEKEIIDNQGLNREYPRSLTTIRMDLWFEELCSNPVFLLVSLRQLRYYGGYYGSYADFVNGIMYRFAMRHLRKLRAEQKPDEERVRQATDILLAAVNQTAENLHSRHCIDDEFNLADEHGQKLEAFLNDLTNEIPTDRQTFIDLLAGQPEHQFWLDYFEVKAEVVN